MSVVAGWALGREGKLIAVQAVLLHLPFLGAIVMAIRRSSTRRPPRLTWLGIGAASALSVFTNVAFLAQPSWRGAVGGLAGAAAVLSEAALALAAYGLLRRRRHRLPFTWALDLVVAAAGAVTFALLTQRWADSSIGAAWLQITALAVGTATALILVQLVVAGASRDWVIVALAGAVAVRQLSTTDMILAHGNASTTASSVPLSAWWADPRPLWAVFAVLVALAAAQEEESTESWTRGRLHAHSAGSWSVPTLCMAQAVTVLIWHAGYAGAGAHAVMVAAAITLSRGSRSRGAIGP